MTSGGDHVPDDVSISRQDILKRVIVGGVGHQEK